MQHIQWPKNNIIDCYEVLVQKADDRWQGRYLWPDPGPLIAKQKLIFPELEQVWILQVSSLLWYLSLSSSPHPVVFKWKKSLSGLNF